MMNVLNDISELAYRARHSRLVQVTFVIALGACVALLTLARGDRWEDTTIVPFDSDSSPIALLNRYVRVSGVLLPERAFHTQADIGGLKLSGARYIPLVVEEAQDPLLVLDKDVPPPGPDGEVRLVGKIQEGGLQVPYYLEVGQPPNIPLQNALAHIGLVGGALLIAGALIAWLLGRADYAVAVGQPTAGLAPAGVGALWFGSLGAQFGHAVVRQAPVIVTRTRDEVRLDSSTSRPHWRVHIRDVRSVRPTCVATSYGPLPAARIEFQDERGLLRRGTIAVGGDLPARNELHAWLSGRIH
ncbi:MAG: hypothetical protein K6U78_17180 [Anaerolineae bacterium]|nr:hypothetical protein [Anaerolineae bacterium]